MREKPVTDYEIQALVDSQLSWEDEKSVWLAIEADSKLKKRYQELINQKKALLLWWSEENDDFGGDGNGKKANSTQVSKVLA